ncbi:hypothetical protein FB563_3834 [Streptomyces puniciscabiei]|uniref:Gram-positive cocci surface proteins LPxTG domain-containing protein n=1 Tax=Streptomyces puniciscabiei TaxID=164348 RepID=A0A542UI73_9ACTN|nr:hypothetical protein [Streptomyces puniciscabiei]TQK98790.1 hypothetical protein FB563_3834 [Streptomyces puniciscabiei]
MRLCTPLSRLSHGLAAAAASAAVCVVVPATPAAALADPPPACVGGDPRAFPLAARIRGGPPSYEAGGGYGTWYLDLTNTTRRKCTGVHPVIVLVDDKRALRPDQPKLEFYDGPTARPVTFEGTDEQELVGVLDGAGFDGFAVPPGRTVSVKVRLVFPAGTAADQVTANAAVVQRRGADGDWIGESNAYRFGIGEYASPSASSPSSPPSPSSPSSPPIASGSPQATPGTGTSAPTTPATPASPGEAKEQFSELALTGPGLANTLLAAAAAALGASGAALLLTRKRR